MYHLDDPFIISDCGHFHDRANSQEPEPAPPGLQEDRSVRSLCRTGDTFTWEATDKAAAQGRRQGGVGREVKQTIKLTKTGGPSGSPVLHLREVLQNSCSS